MGIPYFTLAETSRKATFVECDISSWKSILNVFKLTYEKYGQIDIVAANAGIHGHERWLEDIIDANGDLAEPDYPAISVNLIGMLYSTSRVN
jgi:NAD(P)-dependent dehydrogenase (short-subunit alcohol dehydrogenase family)